jgi:hypothetical protein
VLEAITSHDFGDLALSFGITEISQWHQCLA